MDNISIIIRCKNEERWVGHTIQSILDKTDKPEIIVVDNNSTDNSIQIVNSFKENPMLEKNDDPLYTQIKIINMDDYTPGKALNVGVKNCSNDNILMISSHCVLTKINLQKHILDVQKHCVIFGNQIPQYYGKKIHKRYIWANFGDVEKINYYAEQERRYFLHNALSFYKKQVLLDNPFDENLTSREDRYWINKMIKNGYTSLYDPELETNHHYTDSGATWKGIG